MYHTEHAPVYYIDTGKYHKSDGQVLHSPSITQVQYWPIRRVILPVSMQYITSIPSLARTTPPLQAKGGLVILAYVTSSKGI